MAGPLGEMFDHGKRQSPMDAVPLLISPRQAATLSTQQ